MKKYKKSKRYYYFRKQRRYGLAVLALSVLAAFLTSGDITATILLAPLGVYLVFTKEMVIMDDYYYEMQAKKFDKWREP